MADTETAHCLNCGTNAPGRFCPQCGQSTELVRRSFVSMAREGLDHLSFDTALPRSVATLLFRPGRLTELYLEGKRASYVTPLRMYLVISLIFFFIFVITPPNVSQVDLYVGGELVGPAQTSTGDGPQVRRSIQILAPEDSSGFLSRWVESSLLAGKRDRFRQMDPQLLVDGVFNGLQRYLKMALFVFIPLLALALRALFLRSGNLYFDHLIFALHLQSFLFLVLSVVWVFHSAALYALVALVVFPIYLFRALRRVYRQPARLIVPKFLALAFAYLGVGALVLGSVMVLVMRAI